MLIIFRTKFIGKIVAARYLISIQSGAIVFAADSTAFFLQFYDPIMILPAPTAVLGVVASGKLSEGC